MKNIKKPVVFIIALSILAFAALNLFGVSTYYGDNTSVWVKSVEDIRWGIDIRGGVDVTFTPPEDYEGEITEEDMIAAESIIKVRLLSRNITEHEVYTDYATRRINVRFPWQASDTSFDPEKAVDELGEMAALSFREGDVERDFLGNPVNPVEYLFLPQVLEGRDVKRAFVDYQDEYVVVLELESSGEAKFAEATGRLAPQQGVISIWMDDVSFSAPQVRSQITGGVATITGGGSGGFELEEARDLANKINGGALPFALKTDSFSVINPSMGEGARDAMVYAGIITFAIIAIMMIIRYKILGAIAVVGLTGQLFAMLAIISGFFGEAFLGGSDSFTLTIPGIAGIILSLGMGVDANIITSERIKEELRSGKTLDGAVQSGYKRAFSAIFDGNVTVIIVAFVLMGAFGSPGSFATTILSPIFFAFGPSAEGSIYAFGFTLIIGSVLNFVFGVFASRLMTYSAVKYKTLRKPTLYGAYKNDEQKQKDKSKSVFDAVAARKKFLVAPIILITLAVSMSLIIKLPVAIEFRGGTILNYTYEGEINTSAVKGKVEELNRGLVNVNTGTAIGGTDKTITVEFSSAQGLTVEVQRELTQSLEEAFPDNNLNLLGSQDVNPRMGHSFFMKCLVAVIFSFVVLMVYIALRFKAISGWSAGAFSLLTLMINVLIVFSTFVFFRFPINANFMAVVLTILCYSINDTIVVFDRIRENKQLYGKKLGYNELVNKSVGQSFARSLNTSITTCTAMLVISVIAVVAGVGSMLTFALPLLIGLIAGFITSLYTVGPFWAVWQNRTKSKK
ncbi:MAG: protein translocase subunit SecF [Oscillospiraceae bacterium]|nr:protein translocase subunit SecF [Oscillospiraceae bacterium]